MGAASKRARPPGGFVAGELLEAHATGVTFEVERGGQVYVCKRLSGRGAGDPEQRRRLVSEGRLLAVLAGRGAPRLIERGEDSMGPFLVVEKIAMRPLGAFRRGAEGGAGAASDWFERAARSAFARLAEVHEAGDAHGPLGVVHGDISMANVLLTDGGDDAKVIDFGLARWRDGATSPKGAFRGTILYAAPELARGESIDARADLFALAAALLHARSGVPPRSGDDPAAALLNAGEQPIDAWARSAAHGLAPRTVEALVECCLFDRRARWLGARRVFA